jgi:hypothetical protein
MSLTDISSRDLRNPFAVNLVGLANYVQIFSDPRFVRASLNTLYFVLVGIPVTLGLALVVALADLGDDYQGRATPETRLQARRHLVRALEIFHAAGDITGYTLVFESFAVLAYLSGNLSLAARLSGAVHRLELDTGTGINLWNREILGFNPAVLGEDPAHRAEWEEGMALDIEAAVALALAEPAAEAS